MPPLILLQMRQQVQYSKSRKRQTYLSTPFLPIWLFLGSCTSLRLPRISLSLCLPMYFGRTLPDHTVVDTLSSRGLTVQVAIQQNALLPILENLWHHFQAPYQLALLGYVVVATDYAGLGVATDASGKSIVHEYISGPAQANDVLYSILAAQAAFPELSKEFVVLGSSEGGSAAWSFAQKMACEPLDGHLGTIALSPLTRLLSLPQDESIIPFLLLYLTPTLKANYGPFDPNEIFTLEGVGSLDTLANLQGCNIVLFQLGGHDILKPGWQNNPSVQRYQAANINGGKEIRGPLLAIQGGDDPIIHTPTVETAVTETIEKFPDSQIEYPLLPNVTHASAMYAGLQIYLEWIVPIASNAFSQASKNSICTKFIQY